MERPDYVILGCEGPGIREKVIWTSDDPLAAEQEFERRVQSPYPGWPWYRLVGWEVELALVRSTYWPSWNSQRRSSV